MEIKEQFSIKEKQIIKVNANGHLKVKDFLATEEPLEISVEFGQANNRSTQNVAITMRTPGNDELLSLGFLLTEGIIQGYDEVEVVKSKGFPLTANPENKIKIAISPNSTFDIEKLSRHLFTSSSCGVCGKTSIDNLRTSINYQLNINAPKLDADMLYNLPDVLNTQQNLFERTGGIHAAGLFNPKGDLVVLQEDVGRHNALDKLIGWALKQNLIPLNKYLILVSGRASFELVQKALMAGCPVLAAVGAPSTMAVELAEAYKMTVIGFLKKQHFNIYTQAQRIV